MYNNKTYPHTSLNVVEVMVVTCIITWFCWSKTQSFTFMDSQVVNKAGSPEVHNHIINIVKYLYSSNEHLVIQVLFSL